MHEIDRTTIAIAVVVALLRTFEKARVCHQPNACQAPDALANVKLLGGSLNKMACGTL